MSQAPLTEDLVSRLKDESYCTSSDVWAVRLDAAECLEQAIPFLRRLTQLCEDCEGAGEIIVGHAPDDYSSEPCKQCKPIWDLIERIQPPRRPTPTPVPTRPVEEEEDDIAF